MQAIHPEIESLRRQLKKNHSKIQRLDFGAGSQSNSNTVSGITKNSLKQPKDAARIGNLAKAINAKQILELGTSLGLTTAYLAQSKASIITCEGDPAIAQLARENWKALDLTNIRLEEGPFASSLPQLIEQWKNSGHSGFDLIFIDGHHIGEALLYYVDQLKPWLTDYGILVCDDIHWSSDMEAAWVKLTRDPHWTNAIDFYEWGMLTANPDLTKEIRNIRL